LEELAANLPGPSDIVAADLSTPPGLARVKQKLSGRPVGVLVNAAGFGFLGPFHVQEGKQQAQMITLNTLAVSELTRICIPGMIERAQGAVIIVSSVAALQGGPWAAAYTATKSFGLSLAESLWVELHPRGVDVLALCPGLTRTEFMMKAGIDARPPGFLWANPDDVVCTALKFLGRRPVVLHGWNNRLQGVLVKFLPRRWVTSIAGMLIYGTSPRLKKQI
jgi:short-subunit dehydrogenase